MLVGTIHLFVNYFIFLSLEVPGKAINELFRMIPALRLSFVYKILGSLGKNRGNILSCIHRAVCCSPSVLVRQQLLAIIRKRGACGLRLGRELEALDYR